MKRTLSLIVLLGVVVGAMVTGCNNSASTDNTAPSTNAAPEAPAAPATNAPAAQ